MDDRLAKHLYENNLLDKQKQDEARISLLEKLHTPQPVEGQVGGDVSSDSGGTSVQYNFPLFSTNDGRRIYDGGINAGKIAPYGSVFYLDETAADVAGYKTMAKDFYSVTPGTTVKSCTSAGDDFELVEEFISSDINSPFILEGAQTIFFYASADVEQDVQFQFEVYKRDVSNVETLLNTSYATVANNITGTPVKVLCWNIFEHAIVDLTDRLVIKLYCKVAMDADITIYFGDATYPSYFSHPFSMLPNPVGGGEAGYILTFQGIYTTILPADASIWIGELLSLGNTASNHYVYPPKAGSIKRLETYAMVDGGFSSGEAADIILYLNGDPILYSAATFDLIFAHGNSSSLDIPIIESDTLIVEIATPGWTSEPTGVQFAVVLYISTGAGGGGGGGGSGTVNTDITLTGDGSVGLPLHTKVVISPSEPATTVAEMFWVDTS